jgi:hypothetical protein
MWLLMSVEIGPICQPAAEAGEHERFPKSLTSRSILRIK